MDNLAIKKGDNPPLPWTQLLLCPPDERWQAEGQSKQGQHGNQLIHYWYIDKVEITSKVHDSHSILWDYKFLSPLSRSNTSCRGCPIQNKHLLCRSPERIDHRDLHGHLPPRRQNSYSSSPEDAPPPLSTTSPNQGAKGASEFTRPKPVLPNTLSCHKLVK